MLIVTMADPKRFTPKDKLVTYTGVFVKFSNQRNCRQVYEIHEIIELEKIHALTIDNPCNLSAYQIIKISLVLQSVYIISRN